MHNVLHIGAHSRKHFYKGRHVMSKVSRHALSSGGVPRDVRSNTLNSNLRPGYPHFRRVPDSMSAGTLPEETQSVGLPLILRAFLFIYFYDSYAHIEVLGSVE